MAALSARPRTPPRACTARSDGSCSFCQRFLAPSAAGPPPIRNDSVIGTVPVCAYTRADGRRPRRGAARARGLRVTASRLAVLETLYESLPAHVTVEQVEAGTRAAARNPLRPRPSTTSCGRSTAPGSSAGSSRPGAQHCIAKTRVGDNHHHLVCRDCGRTVATSTARSNAPRPASTPATPRGSRSTRPRSSTFKSLDLDGREARHRPTVMTAPQGWWPADYGHYGPLLIRLAGTAPAPTASGRPRRRRARRAPLRAAQQLAGQRQPRQGAPAAVADQGEVRPEDLLGRPDRPRRQLRAGVDGVQDLRVCRRPRGRLRARTVTGGPRQPWLGDARYSGERELANPLGAVQMGLIYVNPEGPNGNPDPLAAARDIRETFARMAMNDEETVALIAGGHTFGKTHGAAARRVRRPRARGRAARAAGPRLEEHARHRQRRRHDHQRAGGRLDHDADRVGQQLLRDPLRLRVGAGEEPGRRPAVDAEGGAAARRVPDPTTRRSGTPPMMLTTDLALQFDPIYEPISRRFHEHPEEFADAFAKAWFKLTHRDMGPISRYLGQLVPRSRSSGRTRSRAVDHELIGAEDVAALKAQDPRLGAVHLPAGLDRLGVGVDVPRHRQARRRQRRAHPPRAAEGLGGQQPGRAGEGAADARGDPAGVQRAQAGEKQVSLADLIVLGGCAAVEQAAKNAGHDVEVPSRPGARTRRRSRPTWSRSPCSSRPPTGSATTPASGYDVSGGAPAGRPGAAADADRAGDDGARRRPARPGRQPRAVRARRLHRPARDADQRLLREPARHGHRVEADLRRTRRPSRGATARRARRSGPAAASTWSSARTRSSARSPRSTPQTTRRRSSCGTSWPRGTR